MKQPIIRLSLLGVGFLFLCSTTGTELNASTTGFNNEKNNQTTDSKVKSFLSNSNSVEILSSEESSESSIEHSSIDTSESRTETSEQEGTSESFENETTKESSENSTSSIDETEVSTSISTELETSPEESIKSEDENSVVNPPVAPPSISKKITKNTVGVQYLPKELKANKFSKNDLAGFELPLLSSYLNKNQGALVYEGIKKIGVNNVGKTTTEFIDRLYQELFNQSLNEVEIEETTFQYLFEGDSVYLEINGKLQLMGLYLGNHLYITIEQLKEKDGTIKVMPTIKKIQKVEGERILVRRGFTATLTDYGQKVLREYPATFNFIPNFITERFIERIGEDARALGLEYDVFPSVMIAQAILESGGGSSELSQAPYYNLFGIKGDYQGSSVTFATKEDQGNGEMFEIAASFRSYPTYAASLSDYVQLIRGGISGNTTYYEGAWRSNAKNYLRATHELTGKYATDSSYHNKINSLIAAYHLTEYDEAIVTETGLFIQGIDNVPMEYRSLMAYPNYNGKDYNTSGSYPVGQCTWYAFNRVNQLGMTVDDFMGNGGEWGASGQRLGYQVSDTPEAGTLISFTPGTAGSSAQYGHVAFVEAVGPNGILISEGNVYGETTISYRVISNELAYSNLVSYITAPQKK